MRWIAGSVAALVVAGSVSSVGWAEEPEAPAARTSLVEVWQGYVWKDAAGRVRLGRGVVAMGVMAMPPWSIEGPVTERLLPYATGDDDWFFWNYALSRPEPETLAGVPTVLVRLEGRVTEGEDPHPHSFPSQAPRTMRDARLRTIEFLPPEWLRDWAFFFRTPGSPFRVAERAPPAADGGRGFAAKALETLTRMRSRPSPGAQERERARAVDPEARVVTRFREGEEADIQRWLVETCRDQRWTLPGLDALPPLPPSTTEIQGWFLDSPTKEAFLAKAREAWPGDPGRLLLVHYVATANQTSYDTADLDEVRDHWTEADYQAHRKTTGAMGVLR